MLERLLSRAVHLIRRLTGWWRPPSAFRWLSSMLILLAAVQGTKAADTEFVRPSANDAGAIPVWGHVNGLRIGLEPTPGPAGLIRIYTPYLEQHYPRVVNFVSIEPSVVGRAGRGQSELEMSRLRPGRRGLVFWASNERSSSEPPTQLASGVIDEGGETLRLFVHTEPFRNGARPVIECVFRKARLFEVEFLAHDAESTAPIESCTLSATMGNFGLLRRIHLNNDRVVAAKDLWQDERLDELGFLPWRQWAASELKRTDDGRFLVEVSTDMPDPADVAHDKDVAPHWRYVGNKAVHYWRAEADSNPFAAVNGRRTYWMSKSSIPGGVAFENFELGLPFQSGQRLWFGVKRDDDSQ